jgi:hypothetical protein
MKRILIVILLSVGSWAQDAARKSLIKTDVGANAPRYQLFVNPEVRADTLLLDTTTGKVWRMTEITDASNHPKVWKYEDRMDNRDQEIAWWSSHSSQTGSVPTPATFTPSEPLPKPKIDEVDPATGKPKYATFGEYEDAKDVWNRQETIRELQALHPVAAKK